MNGKYFFDFISEASIDQKLNFMKIRKLLPKFGLKNKSNQKGQSIVEFVLLLAVISGISFAFVALMNRSLTKYWVKAVKVVVEDETQTIEIP